MKTFLSFAATGGVALLVVLASAASLADGSSVEGEVDSSKKVSVLEYDLEHAIGTFAVGEDGPAKRAFFPRGALTLKLSKKTYQVTASLSSKKMPLPARDIDSFRKLVAEGGDYTIRARAKGADPASPWIVASVPACLLAANKFSEVIQLHVATSGELSAMEYLSPQMTNTCPAGGEASYLATLSSALSSSLPCPALRIRFQSKVSRLERPSSRG